MGELAQTQEAARAKGKAKPKLELVYCDAEDRELTPEEVAKLDSSAKIAAMNRGARNAGIKEGRQRERGEILKVLGVQRLQDASQINRLTAERDARPTAEEMRHAKRAAWAQGGLTCSVIVGALVIVAAMWITNSVIDGAFDAAGRIRAQSDLTEALVRSQQEPQAQPYTNPGQDVTRRP